MVSKDVLLNSNDAAVSSLAQQIAHLPAGAHVCLLYDTDEEQTRAIVPYFQAAVRAVELGIAQPD